MKKTIEIPPCDIDSLPRELQKVHTTLIQSKASKKFEETKTHFSPWTWLLICILRICGLSHYNTMAVLGYTSYLFDTGYIRDLLGKKKRKKLLDIWAGSWSITEVFKPYVEKIFYTESSYFFRRQLRKRGFLEYKKEEANFDIILMLNLLDRCTNAQKMIQKYREKLNENGLLIISLPFPIHARYGNWLSSRKQQKLTQDSTMSFESWVSIFYDEYIAKNNLKVKSFARTKYIVRNPELWKNACFDNAIFVCSKKTIK